MKNIAIVGNPNAGKTTLFNALTGAHAQVGNWAGVTVEIATAPVVWSIDNPIQSNLLDLPGLYSFAAEQCRQDEALAMHALLVGSVDVLLNVVDASCLERHLYLSSQLFDLGKPCIIALTGIDKAHKKGIQIDIPAIAQRLQCPVIPIMVEEGTGLLELQIALQQAIIHRVPTNPLPLTYSATLKVALDTLEQQCLADNILPSMARCHLLMQADAPETLDLADAQYEAIHTIVQNVLQQPLLQKPYWTEHIDRLALHPWWGIPIFMTSMYFLFFFAIHVGGIFQDPLNILSQGILVDGSQAWLQSWHLAPWLITLLSNGIGSGLQTTLTFVPVMLTLFFGLSVLEFSGYMPRAAFVVDRLMRGLGLPGKSFVPLLVGFGCNVPAIMATRTLESPRSRWLTALMIPFMSCSARLSIYAAFVSIFFPTHGASIVFSLYLCGISLAMLTAWVVTRFWPITEDPLDIVELPEYQLPKFSRLWQASYIRLVPFITRATKLIVPISMILSMLNYWTWQGQPCLWWVGKALTPWFAPIGISPENWPATVALLTGILAKEVVMGTLNTLYSPALSTLTAALDWSVLLDNAWHAMQTRCFDLGQALLHPFLAAAPITELTATTRLALANHFDGTAGAYAYLLFILLYIPCVSTMSALRQETSRRWMWFSILWSSWLAYGVSVTFYQIATFAEHPGYSMFWFTLFLVGIVIGIIAVRYIQEDNSHVARFA
ncbi:MAG: ferrous iron transport protein B [Legionellaceae bacterium]|nr:ferrous iron transport protein B [Legionellaceae bacterium]